MLPSRRRLSLRCCELKSQPTPAHIELGETTKLIDNKAYNCQSNDPVCHRMPPCRSSFGRQTYSTMSYCWITFTILSWAYFRQPGNRIKKARFCGLWFLGRCGDTALHGSGAVILLFTVNERDQIGVLLDRTRLAYANFHIRRDQSVYLFAQSA